MKWNQFFNTYKETSTMNEERLYHGDGKVHYQPLSDAYLKEEPYIADSQLVEAVNTAIFLRRPLLVEGDPGCGKTRLAYAVAYELAFPLKPCYIRSTSRATDLLYTYDALNRLYDLEEYRICDSKDKPKERTSYVHFHELGEAIRLSINNIPSVVLIDEIDKADVDFPNDLLLLLDEWKFKLNETDELYDALQAKTVDERKSCLPLVIITSNREKELPAAFLRRCLYYYIEFPDPKTLDHIVKRHFPPQDKMPQQKLPLFDEAVKKFLELRNKLIRWRKVPSTSELIDWLRLLKRHEEQLSPQELADRSLHELPYLETLVKTQSDLNALSQA
jgi:MoxR-like ATPase